MAKIKKEDVIRKERCKAKKLNGRRCNGKLILSGERNGVKRYHCNGCGIDYTEEELEK